MTDIHKVFIEREKLSCTRLDQVRVKFSKLKELEHMDDLTIFAAGSYARHEASEYSDIDMFFLCGQDRGTQVDPRTKELRLFGKMIDVVEELNFPKFSNDCQYLTVISADEILQHLGSPRDDHENYFTARMLLLLESKCLFGEKTYNAIIQRIVTSYFVDYPDHSQKFQPIFLLNDICRYWKTILLNYENKRNKPTSSEEQKIIQKVRNFKLKFSRMTTCFATISALGSYNDPVTEEHVIELTRLTPRERLQGIVTRKPTLEKEVEDVLDRYSWFLEMTGLSTKDLHAHFSDKKKRFDMFQKANEYGHAMFTLLQKLDDEATEGDNNGLLRYLVI